MEIFVNLNRKNSITRLRLASEKNSIDYVIARIVN